MKLILTENVDKVGVKGEIVTVKAGYGRNYLLPRGLATAATRSAIQAIEEEAKTLAKKQESAKKAAEKMAAKLSTISITATVAAGEDDKIFGSVTAQNIADLLAEKGYEIDRHTIVISEPIKALGVYNIPIKVYHDVKAEIKLWVIKES